MRNLLTFMSIMFQIKYYLTLRGLTKPEVIDSERVLVNGIGKDVNLEREFFNLHEEKKSVKISEKRESVNLTKQRENVNIVEERNF